MARGGGSDGGLDQGRVDVAVARLDVDEHRLGAGQHDGLGRGGKGEGRGDDLVAGADALGHQGDQERPVPLATVTQCLAPV